MLGAELQFQAGTGRTAGAAVVETADAAAVSVAVSVALEAQEQPD